MDVKKLIPRILERVAEFGDVCDMRAWRRAFPDREFMELDDGLTGEPVRWEERTPLERAVYLAYMNDPQRTNVFYQIDASGYSANYQTDDSEIIWYLWFYGALRGLEEEVELEEEARKTLLTYVARQAGEFEDLIMDEIPLNEVVLERMEMDVAPFPLRKRKA